MEGHVLEVDLNHLFLKTILKKPCLHSNPSLISFLSSESRSIKSSDVDQINFE